VEVGVAEGGGAARREPFAAAGARRRYMSALRKFSRSGSGKRKASKLRRRMISYNRSHSEDSLRKSFSRSELKELEERMPLEYRKNLKRVLSTKDGRAALKRYRKFWGLPFPTEIKIIETPGVKRASRVLVGMGRSGKGGVFTDGKREWHPKGTKYVATDASGRKIFLFTGKDSSVGKKRLKKVGKVEETHYVPTGPQEKAGTFKRGKYWVHRHDDAGGRFPDVFVDSAGNYEYGRGTYSVTDWIRR